MTTTIPDIQSTPDTRRIPIAKVGIKGIRHPIRVLDRQGGEQSTVATFNLYVNLPHEFKGTHMSRFVEVIEQYEREIDIDSFLDMLPHMTRRLDAEAGHIEMTFPYFIKKTAPVSGVESLLDYRVSFIGEQSGDKQRLVLKVWVPVTSLSPSSRDSARRGAHNQRAEVCITARIRDFIWVEELIEVAEQESSSELYGLLKRPDEKHVTERAYDNPKSVVDMVRDIATRLNADARIEAYTVEAESFESIHNHSVYAQVVVDKSD
jgi:GTP cyclohydrolase I